MTSNIQTAPDFAVTGAGLDAAAIRAIPKVELHLHLDTSVRVATVAELARKAGFDFPTDPAAQRDALNVPMDCASLNEYLERVAWEVAVLQTPEAIERATYELFSDCAADGIIYAEVRFAPQLCTRNGLTMDEVIRASARGYEAAHNESGIGGGLIMCLLRHDSADMSDEVVRAALDAREAGLPVYGLDIAADETLPGAPHEAAFRLAQIERLHRTCHAGEAAGATSIAHAIDVFGAERIGHGVRLHEDPALLRRVADMGIILEMCPTSNVQTKATPTLAAHPINDYLRAGVRLNVSCDGRTTSNTDQVREYGLLVETFGWGEAEIRRTARYSAEAAFCPDNERAALLTQLEA